MCTILLFVVVVVVVFPNDTKATTMPAMIAPRKRRPIIDRHKHKGKHAQQRLRYLHIE